jgi:hypothetical protein
MCLGHMFGLKPGNALVQFAKDFRAGHDLSGGKCASLTSRASSHPAGAIAGVGVSSMGR